MKILTFWIVYKADADRPYVWTKEPSKEQCDKWRSEGFRIYRMNAVVPVEPVEVDASFTEIAAEVKD